jgi:1-acyl-sn-glycerol-3-phosphate acyltransferase
MANIEEELRKKMPVIKGLSSIALLGKRIVVKGQENFVKQGPNIIVGNHIGSYKDIATLFKVVPRQIFFTANESIFDKDKFNLLIRKHAQRHLKKFGLFLDLFLTPLKSLFVNYISTNIGKVGAIPVDLYRKKSLAMEQCQKYLKKGKAIITLQGRGIIQKREPNPYVSYFRKGASLLAYNLYKEERISVPVTPLAIFGTHFPFLIPAKIKVNIGEAMHIKPYFTGEISVTVDRFRDALEKRVNDLLAEILTW